MSEFNELYEHLKQCVDSDNKSFIGVSEDGVEFHMFEWAFGLAVKAKSEHDKLVEDNAKLHAEKAELIRVLDLALDAACNPYACSEDFLESAQELINKLQ